MQSLAPPTLGLNPSGGDIAPTQDKETPQAHKQLVEDLTGLYATVGLALSAAHGLAGGIVIVKAEDRAREVVEACKHNKKAMALLKKLTKSSAIGKLVIGHSMMVLAITVAVDRVPLTEKTATILAATGYEEVVKVKIQQQSDATAAA